MRSLFAPLHRQGKFFSSVLTSGSHELSLRMIANRTADVAAIDNVTYALLARHRPLLLSKTRALCCSVQVAAPPYVAAAQLTEDSVTKIREAMAEVLADPTSTYLKNELMLDGVSVLPLSAYQQFAELEKRAGDLGYDEMPGTSREQGKVSLLHFTGYIATLTLSGSICLNYASLVTFSCLDYPRSPELEKKLQRCCSRCPKRESACHTPPFRRYALWISFAPNRRVNIPASRIETKLQLLTIRCCGASDNGGAKGTIPRRQTALLRAFARDLCRSRWRQRRGP